ncbi:MAG: extracellular solute-binding protein, partial [Synergistaceae bacterium]|nr:extracellular solute-binding protein [Synergistaceae bacterium]
MKKALSLCLALAMVLTMGLTSVTVADVEQITLTYLNWNGGEEARLQQEAIDEYMENNPHITIEGQWITEQYDAKINTMVAANEVPDIYYINEYLAAEWGNKGVAAELGPIFESIGVNLDEEFVPTALF